MKKNSEDAGEEKFEYAEVPRGTPDAPTSDSGDGGRDDGCWPTRQDPGKGYKYGATVGSYVAHDRR